VIKFDRKKTYGGWNCKKKKKLKIISNKINSILKNRNII
jgi:hypothetical protein